MLEDGDLQTAADPAAAGSSTLLRNEMEESVSLSLSV